MNRWDIGYLVVGALTAATAAMGGGVIVGFLVVGLAVGLVLRLVWLRADRDAVKDRAEFAARIREVGR